VVLRLLLLLLLWRRRWWWWRPGRAGAARAAGAAAAAHFTRRIVTHVKLGNVRFLGFFFIDCFGLLIVLVATPCYSLQSRPFFM